MNLKSNNNDNDVKHYKLKLCKLHYSNAKHVLPNIGTDKITCFYILHFFYIKPRATGLWMKAAHCLETVKKQNGLNGSCSLDLKLYKIRHVSQNGQSPLKIMNGWLTHCVAWKGNCDPVSRSSSTCAISVNKREILSNCLYCRVFEL